ncbi:hypothetical protein SLEP1_g51041 [Rubroshorea leprosula]|uniref:Wax synthase domain-containing protein n=1 Tax=Rubroshorea leprosula TaxID=152421 RepID=A0AAV5M4D5_9ROSI|nr:hypothetical protein SLEP1_g51041 [Rubroshorea leprosula]
MEEELKSFVKVWFLAITSLCYSYYIAAKIPKGFLRLLSLLPVISLFLFLPMNLSSYSYIIATSIFLSWYANFKLLLLSFDHGPLSPPPPQLLHFICIASLPIKIKRYPSQDKPQTSFLGTIILAIKVAITIMLFEAYNYGKHLNTNIVLALFHIQFLFAMECLYAVFQIPPKFFFGFELEPQFNEPLLANSLQDFWGRRWNLMSSDVLRHLIYNPLRRISKRIIGDRWKSLPAILGTFFVSGLMHEVLYYHLTHLPPTWEATCYFVMHGICVDVEIVMKKKKVILIGRKRQFLINVISRLLVLAFLLVTSIWILFAPLLRNGFYEKVYMEYSTAINFAKGVLHIH